MKLTNKAVFADSLGLGLTIAVCWADGTQAGLFSDRLTVGGTDEGRTADLRTRQTAVGFVDAEALTPDGQAFLDLMVEAA